MSGTHLSGHGHLFTGIALREFLGGHTGEALDEIQGYPEDYILDVSVDDLCDSLVEKYTLEPPTLTDETEIIESGERTVTRPTGKQHLDMDIQSEKTTVVDKLLLTQCGEWLLSRWGYRKIEANYERELDLYDSQSGVHVVAMRKRIIPISESDGKTFKFSEFERIRMAAQDFESGIYCYVVWHEKYDQIRAVAFDIDNVADIPTYSDVSKAGHRLRMPDLPDHADDTYIFREFSLKDLEAIGRAESAVSQGGGFGDSKGNTEVERAAIDAVTGQYETRGWQVESVEKDNCGYDLKCRKSGREEHVEVKGIRGSNISFIITAGEVACAETDPAFTLCAVTQALSDNPRLHKRSASQFLKEFTLTTISYRASITPEPR